MQSKIHHMNVIRYYREKRPWDEVVIQNPTWADVEAAIRKMENYCFPIVQLSAFEGEPDEDDFNVIGGDGRWALFQMVHGWQYTDPTGSDKEVRLWESDQGYYCAEKNILTNIERVLRITKVFFETGSYTGLDDVV